MSIGQRIKQARKINQLSQRHLAEMVGVSAMAISKYERDLITPASDMLMRLAEVLDVSIDFFFRSAVPEVKFQAYRKHTSLLVKDQKSIQARVQEWLERYLEVERLFVTEELEMKLPKYAVFSYDDIEKAAEKLRKDWLLGLDPIEDLVQVLEDRGIKVGLVDGSDHFDACTFNVNGNPVIVTKKDLPGDRQRFNIGHELGHLVLDVQDGVDLEKSAHRFVGALLAPASAVRYELGERRSTLNMNELHLLKQKYGLSMQAWIFRAKDLGIITDAAAKKLFKMFRVKGWHRQEPGKPLPPEEPVRMERLIYRSLVEDLISRSKAQELLGKPLKNRWVSEGV